MRRMRRHGDGWPLLPTAGTLMACGGPGPGAGGRPARTSRTGGTQPPADSASALICEAECRRRSTVSWSSAYGDVSGLLYLDTIVTAHRAQDGRAAAQAKVESARIEADAAFVRYAVSWRMVSDVPYGTPANGASSSGGSR